MEEPRAGTSNHRSDDNFVTTFRQLLKGYFDKKFCGLKRNLVEDAKCNSHNVAKRGKQ